MSVDVAVIGGGVSGLAAAYELRRRGHQVVVLERQVRAGGNAVSERVSGFLMEHGPSSVNAASSAAAELSATLGLDPSRCGLGPGVRYRYLTGTEGLHRISTHPLGFLSSNYLSLGARLRVLAEPMIPRRDAANEESVAGFWSRRFGPEFAERIINKFRSRVTGDVDGIREALAASQAANLAALAHRIKGTSANLAAEPMRAAAIELERLAKAGDLDDAGAWVEQLQQEAERFIQPLLADRGLTLGV